MGMVFKVPGFLIYFVGGLWGLVASLGILHDTWGFIGIAIGLFLAPITLVLAPWYSGFAEENWYPVVLVYGSGIVGAILVGIGNAIDTE